jgi:hypothetical protein
LAFRLGQNALGLFSRVRYPVIGRATRLRELFGELALKLGKILHQSRPLHGTPLRHILCHEPNCCLGLSQPTCIAGGRTKHNP